MKINLSTILLLTFSIGFISATHIAYKAMFTLIESQLNNLGIQSEAHIESLLLDEILYLVSALVSLVCIMIITYLWFARLVYKAIILPILQKRAFNKIKQYGFEILYYDPMFSIDFNSMPHKDASKFLTAYYLLTERETVILINDNEIYGKMSERILP